MPVIRAAELRTAVRSLARTPAVALSAILSLSLGIGATAAISSAVSRALLQPLPFRAANDLVAVFRTTPNSGPMGTWPQSAPNYVDLAHATKRLSALAALSQGTALVSLKDNAVQASQLSVTGNLFPMLGVAPEKGRLIGPDDDQLDQPPVAVISDEFWRSTLGGDPAVIGTKITVDGAPTTIIGVAPHDFRVPVGGQILRADVWKPMRFTPDHLSQRGSNYLQLVGRLADGATIASAQAELRTLFDGLITTYPELRGETIRVGAMHAESVSQVRTPLLLLFAAVCMVLLIAATNVAALLLARGVQRRRETAVRTALGATRREAMRPAMNESFVITAVGGVVGLALAAGGVRTIGALAGARLPQLAGLTVDARVIAFSIVLVLVVAIICGAAPAWRASTVDPQDALRGGRSAADGRDSHRALQALVVLEIGLSLVLLIGAGLVLKGFTRLLGNDPGFDPAPILTLRATVSQARYPNNNSERDFLEPALRAIDAIPGVEAAGAISLIPYVNWGNNFNVQYEGQPGDNPSHLPLVEARVATPGFFAVTKQRLISGRLLAATDDDSRGAAQVAVVNEALVKRDFKGGNAVGKRFHISDTSYVMIVGVVSDVRNVGPISDPRPEAYFPFRQQGAGDTGFPIVVRTSRGDPAAIGSAVRAAIRSVDATAAVASVAPMPDIIAKSLGGPRFYFSLLGTFAAVAILLAIAGLYGVLSYVVTQRTREMGIRAALGSPRGALMMLVTRDGMVLVGFGLLLGLAGGAALTRLMTFMLYGVNPLDVATWTIAVVLMLTAGLCASLIPARRATRVDPLIAIRLE